MTMEITNIRTAELAAMAAPYNPRRISEHDLAALQRSLRFFRGSDEPSDGLTDPDDVPEPPDDPATQRGDLITLGRHRLLCADSANPEDVARLLDSARVQLVNTDPPYNVRVEPRSNNAIAA